MTLIEIEKLTRSYSDSHAELSAVVQTLNEQIETLKRQAMPAIKRLVARTGEEMGKLASAIDGSRECFGQPRTMIFHGVKVGLQKLKGGITWEAPEQVVARIHKAYGEQAGEYLHIQQRPDKAALNKLSACDLRKLGVEVTSDQDIVIIKPTNSEVEKIVSALLKEAAPETTTSTN